VLALSQRQFYGARLETEGAAMKHAAYVMTSVLFLAACNKGPQVDLKNANGNQVTQAVKQSGVMATALMVQPGLWESKATVLEMNVPGMPAQYADKMKQAMAQHQQESSKRCLTAAEINKPKEDFFTGDDKSCHYAHFIMGSGKIDIQMICKEDAATQTTNMSGSYTPTSYSMDMSSNASGGDQSGMTMKMHVDSRRVGECTGKDED
jgi:hypothetical protein